ncbi:MAG: MFS transporter [Opitutaceae bacterium]|nr:MFS transporter [Opitutaceae bacterium]
MPDSSQNNSNSSYKYYALVVLTISYVFNFVDRQVLSILQESIKVDLGLMDWQLGMLSGIAFALFYTTVGIPIARLADKGNRRNIVALAIAVWSFMTVLCGAAQNFIHLMLTRIGVAVGEAGGSPPSHSMISDIFPPKHRGAALGFYSMGVNLGILCGFIVGGWINDLYNWRIVFLVVGIPGILWALVIRFTLREPARGLSEQIEKVAEAPSVGKVVKLLWSRNSFRHMSIAAGLAAFVSYGTIQWLASFFIRNYQLTSTGELATWIGLIAGVSGGLGTFLGGYLTDKLGAKDKRWYVWFPAILIVVTTPVLLIVFSLNSYYTALCLYIIPAFAGTVWLGPTLAMTHGIVSLRMRAMASAILFLILNLIGLGLGPFFTGIMSDLLIPTFGSESLRYALMITNCFAFWAAFHYWKAGKYLKADLKNAPK